MATAGYFHAANQRFLSLQVANALPISRCQEYPPAYVFFIFMVTYLIFSTICCFIAMQSLPCIAALDFRLYAAITSVCIVESKCLPLWLFT